MKHEWLINNGSERLILFFAGWGMDARPFQGIESIASDVLVLFGYHEDAPEAETLATLCAGYARCDVLAWSFGVVMAGQWIATGAVPVTRAVAVNGTPYPAHDAWGIPCDLFDATLEQLSDASLQQFYRRMCGKPEILARFKANAPLRDINDLREELIFLRDQPPCLPARFTQSVVSTRDRIIPAGNQQNCWQEMGVPCRTLEGSHFPFYSITHWEDLPDA